MCTLIGGEEKINDREKTVRKLLLYSTNFSVNNNDKYV